MRIQDERPVSPLVKPVSVPPASGHLIIGVILVVLGLLFLLDTLGVADTSVMLSRGWPLILVVIGCFRLIKAASAEERFGGIAWLFLGVAFLMSRLGYLPFSVWGLIWPVGLISVGMYLVMRSRQGRNVPVDSLSRITAMAFMGGVERKCTSQEFEGGEITAVMGGCEIDLRDAAMAGDEAVIEIFVWAGGIELYIPENWAVVSKVVPIMGGFEDHSRPGKDYSKRIIIRGLVLMGGVEVKN